MSESERPCDRLPSVRRVSFQPVMAAGLNGTEWIALIAAGFATAFVGTLLAWPILGGGHWALLIGVAAGVALAIALQVVMTTLKRQRPAGYVTQTWQAVRHRIVPHDLLIGRHEVWDLDRHD